MLKAAASWDIRITTGNSDSETSQGLSIMESRKRSFSPCLSRDLLRKALLSFTEHSKQMANNHLNATSERPRFACLSLAR